MLIGMPNFFISFSQQTLSKGHQLIHSNEIIYEKISNLSFGYT